MKKKRAKKGPVTLETIGRKIDDLAVAVATGFAEADRRLVRLEQRLDKVERRLEKVEQRLDRVEERLEKVEQRLDRVEQRLTVVEVKVEDTRLEMQKIHISVAGLTTKVAEHAEILAKREARAA